MSTVYCDGCLYYRKNQDIREIDPYDPHAQVVRMVSDDGLCMFHPPVVIRGPEGSTYADVARPRVRPNDFCALGVKRDD